MNEDEESGPEGDADDAAYLAAAPSDILPVDFNLFVLSLNTSALMHLGEAPETDDRAQPNLALARHTIDMLGVLEEKTRGNLTGDEERLLDRLLGEVDVAQRAGEGRDRPPRLAAEQAVDDGGGVGQPGLSRRPGRPRRRRAGRPR